jgi:hypothetical protein
MNVERPPRSQRRHYGAAAACTLLILLAPSGADVPAQAQSSWPFRLVWTHDGVGVDYFQLCANGQCAPLAAGRRSETEWQAALPQLAQGEYRLVVEACGAGQCLPGAPDLVIRVVPPAGRRPPIDVVSGPRVSVGGP